MSHLDLLLSVLAVLMLDTMVSLLIMSFLAGTGSQDLIRNVNELFRNTRKKNLIELLVAFDIDLLIGLAPLV